jgi:hypothetical protein
MQTTFATPGPITLDVELGAGHVTVRAGDGTQTSVSVDGPGADRVTVEHHGDRVRVFQPLGRSLVLAEAPTVVVTCPLDSRVVARLGRAGVTAAGRIGSVRVRTGSGDVRIDELGADAAIDCGSGDVTVVRAAGAVRIRTGSGRIVLDHAEGPLVAASGSGGVAVGTTAAAATLKSGSGPVTVRDAATDLSLGSGSGDITIGRIRRGSVSARAASGDVVIGVPPGVPVWTDVTTVSGTIHSTLRGAGRPEPGQDHLELRVRTVSGDVHLTELAALGEP